ncbi:protein of unknown function [Enterobacter cancerogenus]|nr:protein of unknown function [Enterobacter cancerogenus]
MDKAHRFAGGCLTRDDLSFYSLPILEGGYKGINSARIFISVWFTVCWDLSISGLSDAIF